MHPGFVVLGAVGLIALFARLARASSTVESNTTTSPLLPPPSDEIAPGDAPAIDPGVDADTADDIEAEASSELARLPVKFKSPLKDATDDAWTRYVKLQKQGKLNTVTKSNNLGLFLLGMRVLQDVGMVTGVKLVTRDGRQVWDGDFIPPATRDKFLRNAQWQYDAFRRMTEKHAAYIRAKHRDLLVSKEADVSLSGLLAVAKFAGLQGMDKWLADPATRKEATTNEFKRCNGIF